MWVTYVALYQFDSLFIACCVAGEGGDRDKGGESHYG